MGTPASCGPVDWSCCVFLFSCIVFLLLFYCHTAIGWLVRLPGSPRRARFFQRVSDDHLRGVGDLVSCPALFAPRDVATALLVYQTVAVAWAWYVRVCRVERGFCKRADLLTHGGEVERGFWVERLGDRGRWGVVGCDIDVGMLTASY